MSSYVESPNNTPIASAPLAYPYVQYNDDPNTNAFFTAYNQLAAGYLQWFQQNCLGIYINKSGALLDWIGANLYGIPRPTIGTLSTSIRGAMGTAYMGKFTMGMLSVQQSGTASQLNDDIYKRLLTAYLFLGDGKQMSIPWMRRRIARFLFGVNGSDATVEDQQQVSITRPHLPPVGAMGSATMGIGAMGLFNTDTGLTKRTYAITIPSSAAAMAMQQIFNAGISILPFQITFQFIIQG